MSTGGALDMMSTHLLVSTVFVEHQHFGKKFFNRVFARNFGADDNNRDKSSSSSINNWLVDTLTSGAG